MRSSQSGVTLIELLIIVAIAGAMATLVLPAFSSGLDNLRLSQASDSVAAFLNGALVHGVGAAAVRGDAIAEEVLLHRFHAHGDTMPSPIPSCNPKYTQSYRLPMALG